MKSQQNQNQHQTSTSSLKSLQKRFNFSSYGRLCDQEKYHNSKPSYIPPQGYISYESPKNNLNDNNKQTYAFVAVSRAKRGNFRFSIPDSDGEFSHHPDYKTTKNKSPSWSFSKAQKYQNQKHYDYQICPKNYMLMQNKNPQQDLTKSVKEIFADTVKIKNSSFISKDKQSKNFERKVVNKSMDILPKNLIKNQSALNQTATTQFNYSILGARQTSPIGFYQKSKIKKPLYLNRQGIMKIEQKIQKNLEHQKQPCPKGYIQFYKKRARQPNRNVKQFETYLKNYSDQRQFHNYQMTQYPKKPFYHINMSVHLERDTFQKSRLGPNLQGYKINLTRVCQSNIDLNLKKFRNIVKTRYDRVQAQPNTRLDYDIRQKSLPGMVKMQKVISRHQQLWPVVDPIIKKPEDEIYKKELQKNIKIKQINEAMRPKCNESYFSEKN